MNALLQKFFRSLDEKALSELAGARSQRKLFGGTTCQLELVYLDPPFQIERVTLAPSIVPRHRHPSVDSVEVALWGDSEYSINRHRFHTRYDVPLKLRASPISRTSWHGGIAPAGGSFLSIQYWYRKPVPILEDWEGERLA